MKLTRLRIVSSWLWFAAATLTAQRVETTDRSTDFTNYRTYFWLRVTGSDALWDQRVKDAVNSSLASKGFTQVPSGGQRAVLASRASEEHQKLVTLCDGVDGGWGGGGFWGGPFCQASTQPRPIRRERSSSIYLTEIQGRCFGVRLLQTRFQMMGKKC